MQILLLLALAQSVPPYIPSEFADPKSYSQLTASQSNRLPMGFRARDAWGRTHRLPALTRSSRPVRPKQGLEPLGESRILADGWRDGWQSRRDDAGRLHWRTAIHSQGAASLRLHIEMLGPGETLWIYPTGVNHSAPAVLGPFSGSESDFWTGTVFGDTAILEVESEQSPALKLDRILHQYGGTPAAPQARRARPALRTAPQAGTTPNAAAINAASCEVDATCYPQYNNFASATLHFTFVSEDGFSYVCSGAMLNTRSSSLRPYVATANHCVSTNAEARSVEAFFGYASRTCNTAPVFREDAFRVRGARFLAGGNFSSGDYSLLLLDGNPPPGTVFLGWNSADMPFSTNFIGLHYPRGSWRRIAIGTRSPDRTANISGQTAPANQYYQMTYNLGLTESGSSGSPIISESGQIFGVLSYGPVPPAGRTICDLNPQRAGYGRFSSSFPAYRPFLDDEAPPTLTLSNTSLSFEVQNSTVVGSPTASVSLRSEGAAPTAFTLATSVAWLQARSSVSQVSAAAPASLTITVDPRTLTTSGLRTGSVTVSAGTLVPLVINVSVNVLNRDSSVTLSVNPNPVIQSDPDRDGFSFFYTISAAETAGVATTLTSLTIGGTNFSANIRDWFGSTSLNANSTLQVALRGRNITVPGEVVFTLGGTDNLSRRSWTRTLSVPFRPKPARGEITLTSLPLQVQQEAEFEDCPWLQYLLVTETNGFPIRLTKLIADGDDLSSEIAGFFDSDRVPARGAVLGGICWSGIRPPDQLVVSIEGEDEAGNRLSSSVTTRFVGPVADPAEFFTTVNTVSLSALSNRTTPLNPVQIPIRASRNNAPWTARLIFNQRESSWLAAGPLSGTGADSITLTPTLTGLAEGEYSALLFIESTATLPQLLYIPITFNIVPPLPPPALSAGGVVPNSTYRGPLTAGALASAFGVNLAGSASSASRIPLPFSLGLTSARVNGRPAPLLYAGENQINFQVPWETEQGTATLTVDVAGQSASTTFPVTGINPGIYTSDGRNLVPERSASRSQIILAFLTGVGAVSPSLPTAAAPSLNLPISGLPRPSGSVTATVGGVNARVLFAAIPYGLVGLMQVNLEVPSSAPPGEQPLIVTVNGIASPPAFLTVR